MRKTLKCLIYDFGLYGWFASSQCNIQQSSPIIPSFQTPLYLFSIDWISWRNFSPCSSPTAPRFSEKNSRCEWRKCIFKDMRHPISLYATSYSAAHWTEFDMKFSKKLEQIHLNACQGRSSKAFNAFSNSGSSKTSRICGPTKVPSFNFACLSSVNFLQRNFKTIRILFCHSFH